ncbi:MAG: CHASE2 domain-containing protein [Treponema sp.]|nr:CHASE2 domain-containing protein [Treponema sp.]
MTNTKVNRKTSSFFKSIDFIIFLAITTVYLLLGFFGLFQKLDYRMYDFLLGIRKEPEQSKKVLFVNIDNESIHAIGEWPWSRDVLADCLIRMKELGAAGAVFDIEYLSPSPKGVEPHAEENLNKAFSASRQDIFETINELSSAVASGQVARNEIPSLTNTMISDYIDPSISNLQQSITAKMYRNNDEYFGQAIQFFGNTWLTVNTRDVAIPLSDADKAYVEKRMLLSDVNDKNNFIPLNNKFTSSEQFTTSGFSPAMHSLISRAAGAGFTNVVIDSDGIRRRIELLYEHDGKYLPQLTFAPLLHILDAQSMERTKRTLIVHGALLPERRIRTDIRIPLDQHGRMLINWLHEPQGKSFRNESLLFLKQLDSMEDNIVSSLKYIQSNRLTNSYGVDFEYVTAAQELIKEYDDITAEKQQLLEKCTGYDDSGKVIDGITPEEYNAYFSKRNTFYNDIKLFIDADYMQSINSCGPDLIKTIGKTQTDDFLAKMKENFDSVKNEDETFEQYITSMRKSYKDSFCIIGNIASSTTDLGTNPFFGNYPNVGTHANVFNTIIQQDFIKPVSWLYGMLIACISLFFVMLLSHEKADARQNIAGGICVIGVIVLMILLMVAFGWYIPLVASSLFIITEYIAEIIIRFTSSEKEKGFLRQAFSTYLSKEVVNEIVNDPGKLTLGGEDKHITALFTDIKSFSSFSEMVTPTRLVSILNEYLGLLSDIILQYGGTIDKYIGDEIVSFFGAPLDLSDHAFRACAAGVRMKQAEKLYNEKHLADKSIPRELETRVGVNTGNMVVGNMGTSMKMNYTIMGNDVNLASRLEGVNKIYKSWVLVSEQTWKEADSGQHKDELVSRRLDKVRVVGINKPVQLYNILGFKKEMEPGQLAEIDAFHAALDKYLEKDFRTAGKMFMEANHMNPGDEAALIFADRCKTYIEQGIPENWDGVMNMTTK